jgi:hypothetical protein
VISTVKTTRILAVSRVALVNAQTGEVKSPVLLGSPEAQQRRDHRGCFSRIANQPVMWLRARRSNEL